MDASPLPYRIADPPKPERYLEDLSSGPPPAAWSTRSSDDAERLVRATLRRAALARSDLKEFFSFVYREETTRERIACLPHQRVVFDFIRHYPRCVVRLPTGFSKTYLMAAKGLFDLGRDASHTERGAFLSNAEDQAVGPLLQVRGYIESSDELRLVFPTLRPSQRDGEPWTQTDITVDRPFGIRTPSVMAVGLDSKRVPGKRLSWLNIDDVLDIDNTATPEARRKTLKYIKTVGFQRLDPTGSRCAVTNTPFHPEDLTYALEAIGWPSLNMDCWGGVWFANADDFDSDDLRPCRDAAQEEAETGSPVSRCRLAAHDSPAYSFAAVARSADGYSVDPEEPPPVAGAPGFVDEHERVPLWPERWSVPVLLANRREAGGGAEWARTKEIRVRDDSESRLKEEWVEAAKQKAAALGYLGPLPEWREGNAFTGVDLGFGKGKKSGNVAVFSLAILPTMQRLLLDCECFKYQSGKHTLGRIKAHHDRFGSMVAIESNAAQRLLKEWALDLDVSLRVSSFETNKNKNDPSFGVQSIFLEFENGAWLVPSSARGQVAESFTRWLEDLRGYRPGQHTGDLLMASWIGRERARLLGALKKGEGFWGRVRSQGLGGITSR